MKVLVTGASGFIGIHTLPLLTKFSDEVHAASRATHSDMGGIQWHQIDLLAPEQVSMLMKQIQPTHLLHLAWDVTPGKYWTSLANFQWVQAGLYLLDQFYRHGGKRVVFAGTCAEYDWQYGYFVEDVNPLDTKTPYSVCKTSLYQMTKSYVAQTELSLAWGRIFFPFGINEHPARLIPYLIQTLLKGEAAQTSSGEQIRDLLYVKDLAAAFVALLQSDVEGAVNISSGNPVRLREIILRIADKLQASDLVELGARPDNNEPPMIVGDARRLREEVGWIPEYTLDQALDETIQWWREKLQKPQRS